jgi:hypothetical protein
MGTAHAITVMSRSVATRSAARDGFERTVGKVALPKSLDAERGGRRGELGRAQLAEWIVVGAQGGRFTASQADQLDGGPPVNKRCNDRSEAEGFVVGVSTHRDDPLEAWERVDVRLHGLRCSTVSRATIAASECQPLDVAPVGPWRGVHTREVSVSVGARVWARQRDMERSRSSIAASRGRPAQGGQLSRKSVKARAAPRRSRNTPGGIDVASV